VTGISAFSRKLDFLAGDDDLTTAQVKSSNGTHQGKEEKGEGWPWTALLNDWKGLR
jgi:hypothetical protein